MLRSKYGKIGGDCIYYSLTGIYLSKSSIQSCFPLSPLLLPSPLDALSFPLLLSLPLRPFSCSFLSLCRQLHRLVTISLENYQAIWQTSTEVTNSFKRSRSFKLVSYFHGINEKLPAALNSYNT